MDFNMLYNDPIDDFLAKTRESAKVQSRNPGDVRSVQSMPDEFRGTGVRHSDALREMEIANALHPVAEGLSPEESDKFSRMQVQSERLSQPTQSRSTGSAAIGGNPFSLDTRGLSASVSGIGAAIKDGRNQKKLEEMAPELQEYASRQEAAQTSAQGRRDYLSERIPEVVDTASERDFTRETDQADREHDIDKLDIQGQQQADRDERTETRQTNLENIRNTNARSLAELESTLSNSGGGKVTTGVIQGMTAPLQDISSNYTSSIADLEQSLVDQQGMLDGSIDNLDEMDQDDPVVQQAQQVKTTLDNTRKTAGNINGLLFMLSRPENYNKESLQTAVHDFNNLFTEGREHEFDLQEYMNNTPTDVITKQQLQDYAEQHTGGDADAARRILKGRGASFE